MSANESLTILEQAAELDRAGVAFAMVTLVESLGSAPQDAGARMIVTPSGLHAGTVGGGKVEAKAIAHAMEMLAIRSDKPLLVNWTLKGDVGMTCGGSVKFFFETHHARVWRIVIFGAGHVTQALVPVLLPLKCHLTVFDTRADWLDKLPSARNLSVVASDWLADEVDALPGDAYLICMTQGHSTDLPVIARALSRKQFPYIGVIGSKAKAAVLKKELLQAGVPEERAVDFHCPIGLDFGSNDPHEIALSIAAQLLTIRA